MKKKIGLILGVTGQDGSYLAELLLEKNYEVHGIIRRSSSFNTQRIDHIFDKINLHYGDITDTLSIEHIIQKVKPDEIYNLAAQSHVQVSFELPEYTGQVDALGMLRLLETVKNHCPNTKIYQASTSELFGKVQKEELRKFVLTTKTRVDGRGLEEVRAILCEVGVLPRTHGSALFTRGETQILNIITLGPLGDEQRIDGISLEQTKRYMHHYNFPPYSVGEARSSRGPGRREIGHGALAEKALQCVIPDETEFPYALRLVSEALGSNGSTSMGSVCSSTLSLMDAGVPIKAPVAGVAMGLIKDGNQVAVLTDIQGMEDALGDMDFKVAGTADGITALQMDIKVAGIDKEVLRMALAQAKAGRMHILGKMLEVLKTYIQNQGGG